MTKPASFDRKTWGVNPQNRSPLTFVPDDLVGFEPPDLSYEPCRWATLRTKNVEDMAQIWDSETPTVLVCTDTKLRGRDFVLLSKRLLDEISTPLQELYRGRAAIRVDIEMISASVQAIKHTLNSLIGTLGEDGEPPVESAKAALANVKVLEVQIHRISASVVFARHDGTPPSPLGSEERRLAKELLDDEESDDQPEGLVREL